MTPAQLVKVSKAIQRAAEAGHDRFYGITAATSDMGLAFEDERTQSEWREVVVAILDALKGEEM